MTLHEKLAQARERLIAAGITSDLASVDVDLYARTILGWDRARILADQRGEVPAALEPRFSEWIARRERREPSAYIVGSREFWGLEFAVTPDVLIPRPETELIVDEALERLRGVEAPRVADVGTGSGCVAVAIARERQDSRVVASDLSPSALAVARGNAGRHGVADRVRFVETSYLDGVEEAFDLIAANPPYVKDGDRPALSPDVRHEPEVALFGGAEGLRDLGGVLDAAIAKLAARGWLVMEFGCGQEEHVEALVEARPALRLAHCRHDLQDIARTAVIQLRDR